MPLFILAGGLMNETGISTRLIDFAKAMVGHLRGGLAMVNVVASMLFGGISGSAVADTAALGSVLIPGMVISPPARQKLVRILVSVLLAVFMVMLMVQGTAYTTAFARYYSPILELPLGIVYAALPVAATFMLIAILLDVFKELRPNPDAGESP